MTALRDCILTAAGLLIIAACICVMQLADNVALGFTKATSAATESAHRIDASVDRLTGDAEAACERLTALPEQAAASVEKTAASATAPAFSAFRSLPFVHPAATPSPTPHHP